MGIKNIFAYVKKRHIAAAVVLGALLIVPDLGSQYLVLLLQLIFLYLAFAEMWNLLAGYTGLISLGQQIFIGLGGYALAVLTEYYNLPIWVGILVGGVISGLVAWLLAVLLFRMRGVYFTIATWITAEAMITVFSNWAYVHQGIGFFIKASYNLTTNEIYYAALVVGVGSVVLVNLLLRSRLGLGLMAMRDNEAAAETLGVKIFRSKLISFIISAVLTGIIGGLFYLSQVFIQPTDAFGINWTIAVVFIVVIGGMGTIEGPIIGAIIYVLLQQFLAQYVGVGMIILGVIAIAVILVAPRGIVGTAYQRVNFRLFASHRD
ncbi:MAG: branched-chain amino acid ABC transporter permease [Peptococcaceae bacterium]|nr:branched-chain amino acid ABC transporter permease [Peptococcaceae bacterium]